MRPNKREAALAAVALFCAAAAGASPRLWLGADLLAGRESNVFLASSNPTADTTLLTGLLAGAGLRGRLPLEVEARYNGTAYADHSGLDYHQFTVDGYLPVPLPDHHKLELEAGYAEDRDTDGAAYQAVRAGAWIAGTTRWLDRAYAGGDVQRRVYPGASRADSVLFTGDAGAARWWADRTRLGAGVGVARNAADGGEFSYTEPFLFLTLKELFNGANRARLSVRAGLRTYDDQDPVFLEDRRDTRSRILAEAEHDLTPRISLRATLLYLGVDSSIGERSYHDVVAAAGLRMRWDNGASPS